LQQLLALEAVAISLHSALVWDIAIGEKASNINTQTSEKLGVEGAVQVVLDIL